MSKIVETIHHGNYRNTRVMHIHPVNVADIQRWLDGCPYPLTRTEAAAGQLCSIAASVAHKGSLDRGWVHWEVS
jgi:hypothetical protein